MGIPTLITITGTVRNKTGPLAGRITFISRTLVRDNATNDVMTPHEIVAVVGTDGELSVAIPATNDPGFSPTGWTWEVRPHFTGWDEAFDIAVPYDSPGATLDLSDLAPVPADGTGVLYALVNHTHAGGGGGSLVASSTVASSTAFGQGTVVGVSAEYSRGDHRHGTPTAPTAASVGADATGTAAAAIAAHVALADPHTVYLTKAEGDALYAAIGGGGGAADGNSIFPLSHWGLLTATGSPEDYMAQGGLPNGTLFITRMWVPAGVALTNLYVAVPIAGSGHDGTSAENRLALYNDSGVLVAQTPDLASMWSTVGWRGGALSGGPIAAQGAGRFVYVACLSRGWTSPPSVAYNSSPNDFAFQWVGPGQTHRRTQYLGAAAMPASFTPGTTGTPTGYNVLFGAN